MTFIYTLFPFSENKNKKKGGGLNYPFISKSYHHVSCGLPNRASKGFHDFLRHADVHILFKYTFICDSMSAIAEMQKRGKIPLFLLSIGPKSKNKITSRRF